MGAGTILCLKQKVFGIVKQSVVSENSQQLSAALLDNESLFYTGKKARLGLLLASRQNCTLDFQIA